MIARAGAAATLAVGLAWSATAAASCGGGCPLRLQTQVSFSSSRGPLAPGGAAVNDVNLNFKNIQVDLSNTRFGNQTGRVDGFLTTTDCTKLFDGPYAGVATAPLCKIYLGPVTPGAVSSRQTVPPGQYRVLAQAWADNDSPATFLVDVGIWTDGCSSTLVSP